MSEEEIIKKVKDYISVYDEVSKDCEWYDAEEQESAKEQLEFTQGLLDLYNKQKEEIDYYKKQNEIKGKLLNTSLNETRKHCISKDKIRDKIKEIEEHINFENTEMEDYAIAVLKALLKEKNL